MAAPDLSQRTTVFVAKIGTDDPGYNIVGAPQPRLSIAQALADLASGYNAATPTAPKVISLEPGIYNTVAFALPPNVFIQADPDAEGGSNGECVINLSGNITLSSGWTANTAAIGGFRGVTIRQTTSQNVDFTMPVPVAGNPTRRISLEDVRTSVDNVLFEATGTGDILHVNGFVQDGTSAQVVDFSGGTQVINDFQSAAIVTIDDTGGIATDAQIYENVVTSAAGGIVFKSSVAGVTARMGSSDNRFLTLNRTGAGALTVSADAISIPLAANITYLGTATTANLIRTTDSGGFAPGTAATGTLAFTNNAGNSTISPTAHYWVSQATMTGAARTSILILDVAGVTLTAGDMVDLYITRADGGGIITTVRNATAGGTLLATFGTGLGVTDACLRFVYGTIATGYAANAWVAQSFVIPATA